MKSVSIISLKTSATVFILLATLLTPLSASASATQEDYNFDTQENLTDNFSIKVGPNTAADDVFVQAGWGINNSGGLRIDLGNPTQNRAVILSTKKRYTVKNAPTNSVYKFSLFVRSHEAGYAGIGFTADANDSTSGIYPDYFTPKDALGVSMHGGAFIIHNGNQTIERSWNAGSGDGVTALIVATCPIFIDSPEFVPANPAHDDCASSSGWYRLDMTLTKKSLTTFDLKLEVFRSSATGDITESGNTNADAAFEILGLSNSAIGNAGSLASYINMSGKRFPQIDGYAITLAGGTTFVTAPSAPGTPTATLGVGTVELAWTDPEEGTTPFTYSVTSSPALPAGATCTVTGTTATCEGLTDGTEYSFIVEASNEGGSQNSQSSNTVTFAAATPGTPGTPTAVAGNESATVSVVAPDSGGPVGTYTVTASPGGATCTVTPPATSCVVSGLTNGTPYTFVSAATNGGGTSATSASSNSVIPLAPLAPPGTPGTPTAVAGDGSATVSVVAPNSGGPVASYTVTASPGGATCTVTPPATSCVVSGLTNGTEYTFATTATNASGTSAASSSSNAVTPLAPSGSNGTSTTYVGPVITDMTQDSGSRGEARVTGVRLNTIDQVSVNGIARVMRLDTAGRLFFDTSSLPVGTHRVEFRSSITGVTLYSYFTVTGNAANNSNQTVNTGTGAAFRAQRLFANYRGDRGPVIARDRAAITAFINQYQGITNVRCVGSTSGVPAKRTDRALAQARAKNACDVVKRLVPNATISLETSTGKGTGQRFRSVAIFISGTN